MTELKAGRELDALIAEKVMGWTQTSYSSTGFTVADGNGKSLGWWRFDQPRFGDAQPHYSTSIADAWKVWDHLVSHGWTIGLEYMKTAQGMQHRCDLHRTSDGSVVDAFADTAPLAICLAALSALSSFPDSTKEGEPK